MAEPVDPSKKHFYISIVKSIIRMFAGLALLWGLWQLSGILFIAAEVLGILEEL